MKFYQILSWFTRNLSGIILSQRKTIAYLVFGIIVNNKASLIGIAKGMKTKTTVRHNLKRVARFLANKKINVQLSLLKLQEQLLKKQKEIFLLLDWTLLSDNGYQVLKATVIGEGRGIPFAFKTYKEGSIKNKQTKYEKDFLKYLKTIIPENIEVFIIADRGFGQKPELLKYIEKLGFYYIARNKECFIIKSSTYSGKIENFKIDLEKIYEIKDCLWPNNKNIRKKQLLSRLIIVKKNGFKSRWSITTNNNDLTKEEIISIYSKRMLIEQTFKDEKNLDNGYSIERVKLSSEERYDKIFLLISYAYLLLTLFGALMEKQNMHRKIMANTVKHRTVSLFQVGRYYYNKYDISIPKIFSILECIIFKTGNT